MTEQPSASPLAASDSDDGFQDVLSEMKNGHPRRLELGKEDTLQQGFDQGFAQGAAQSFRFARLRGALGTASACGLLASDCHKDGEKNTSSEETVQQAEDILKSVGVDLSTSSKQ
ncbi:Essential protein Yae1, N-terminal [Phytophthora cactorum]|nr:Essential protein Yae1, N-terminal [Phytophthora cactorum]